MPSRRWLLLFALASAAFLVSTPLALALDGALVGAAVLDWWRARRTDALDVSRAAPSQLSLRESGTATWRVRPPAEEGGGIETAAAATSSSGSAPARQTDNDGPPAHPRFDRLLVTDDLPVDVARLGDDVATLGAVPASASYDFRPLTRGVHELGDVHVRALGPLGLAWRQRTVPRRDDVGVIPGLAEMRRLRLLGLRERLRRAGLRNVLQRGEGTSFESLREYAKGDDPRHVDWKASARRGSLIVRQYEAERSQSVVIALDAGRMMTERLGDRERLDHAMSAALLLADVAGAHGDRVGFFAFADEVLSFLPPRRLAVDRLADAMARVEPRVVEPNYPLAFNLLRSKVRHRSLIVVFTDVIDSGASSAMIAQLTRSAQRHLVLAVTLRNPALEAWADGPADDEDAVYRRAAAEEMLETRALALARMRRSGVLVADTTPDRAVTDVINRYLEVKYRGRI